MIQKKDFDFILSGISNAVIKMIQKHDNLKFLEATISFYSSDLYQLLSNEETKLWHLSNYQIYSLYKEEKTNGFINFDVSEALPLKQNEKINAFCVSVLENFKVMHNLSGKEAIKLFHDFDVFAFLNNHYDVLHTQSLNNTCLDIHDFIMARTKELSIENIIQSTSMQCANEYDFR